METCIGRNLRNPTWRWVVALAIGLTTVALDLLVHWRYHIADEVYARQLSAYQAHWSASASSRADYEAAAAAHRELLAWADRALHVRLVLVVAAPLALLAVARGDRASVGLRETPRQGWRAWGVMTARIGCVPVLAELLLAVVWRWCGGQWDAVVAGYSDPAFLFSEGCVRAPVFEELIYRLALCVPIATRFGKGSAIVASGSLFALVHVTYGNLNPSSAIAGYFFAWVFLKSDSIVLCILLHALGNLLFGLFVLAAGPGPAGLVF